MYYIYYPSIFPSLCSPFSATASLSLCACVSSFLRSSSPCLYWLQCPFLEVLVETISPPPHPNREVASTRRLLLNALLWLRIRGQPVPTIILSSFTQATSHCYYNTMYVFLDIYMCVPDLCTCIWPCYVSSFWCAVFCRGIFSLFGCHCPLPLSTVRTSPCITVWLSVRQSAACVSLSDASSASIASPPECGIRQP